MFTNRLIRSLDWFLAFGILLSGCFVRPLAALFRRHPAGTLIVRPGGMGDLIYTRMAEEYLALEHPVIYLIERRSEVWAKHYGLNYILYDVNPLLTLFRLAGSFLTVVVTEQRYGAACAYGWVAMAIGGKAYGFRTQRLRILLDVVADYDATSGHEVGWFHQLLELAAIKDCSNQAAPVLRQRRHIGDGSIWIGIAGTGVPSRQLELSKWVNIIQEVLGKHLRKQIYIACVQGDIDLANAICREIKDCQVFKGNFGALCDALSLAEFLICMDGGIAHIAAYEGVPVFAAFTSGVAAKWFPFSQGSQTLLASPLPCQPCTRFGQVPKCTNRFACKNFEDSVRKLNVEDLQ